MDKFISIPVNPRTTEPYNARINANALLALGTNTYGDASANRIYTHLQGFGTVPSGSTAYFSIGYPTGEEPPPEWLAGYIADSIIAAGRLPGGESVCPPLPTGPYVIETVLFVH